MGHRKLVAGPECSASLDQTTAFRRTDDLRVRHGSVGCRYGPLWLNTRAGLGLDGGGGYFGVPLSNFLGWFLVTYLYYQAFSLFIYARGTRPPYSSRPRAFWALPILLYLAAGLCHVPPLFDPDIRLVDAGGRVWSAADLRETAVIVMLSTMLPTSILALFRLVRPGDVQALQ